MATVRRIIGAGCLVLTLTACSASEPDETDEGTGTAEVSALLRKLDEAGIGAEYQNVDSTLLHEIASTTCSALRERATPAETIEAMIVHGNLAFPGTTLGRSSTPNVRTWHWNNP
ncbi:hypothetical protein IM25_24885 (plasmid) [Rhodococcus sp. p52]|uniref:hypothetical protein n=1 Tax=unclassified Rhodococcus (in: high G+C Gram-positive bacteria) TaxID=192944 RepID=UPI0002D73F9A|nr:MULTISPECIES: hypothetical protein [unclassified Rhodococcus (in: high G+C Gram-positive bacteria)]AOD24969.1 hypothetical protein IM25_24885 [Rhodococcus sp. p52]MCT7294096.1 hypothetical protein [Rhodococcus sp. PAE-6]